MLPSTAIRVATLPSQFRQALVVVIWRLLPSLFKSVLLVPLLLGVFLLLLLVVSWVLLPVHHG